jgi:hypothetical protein
MLLFKKRFLDAIRSGQKTQTIRLWKHRMMRAGQRSYTPGVGPIRITAVEEVALHALNDADAILDGFDTAVELRRALEEIYSERITAGYRAFRVAFEVMENETGQDRSC